jgi:hypothetical protein
MNGHIKSEKPSNNNNLNPHACMCILQVSASTGDLCGIPNTHMEEKTTTLTMNGDIILHNLWQRSQSLKLNLIVAIHNKLVLNKIKYPVEHNCKVRRN